jgi:hypothetical protein
MQELRLVAVSEDGSYAVLVVPGRSGRFALPIDERLTAVARGQFSRLAQYEIEVESPLRPKEIQDRIRAGETAEEIADAAGLPVERIRRFEGPVLAEREYRAQEAQRATVRGRADAGPGPRLGELVAQRLSAVGVATDEAEWDSRKRPDGNWQIQLAYTVAGRLYLAEWVYDVKTRHVIPDGEEAHRLSAEEADWQAGRPAARAATVTPIGSRASSAGPRQPEHAASADHIAATGSGRAAVGQRARPPALAGNSGPPALAGKSLRPASEQVPAEDIESGPGQADLDQERPAPPARRASGARSRRSSVPSWDEIMFGSSRQPD